MTRFSSQQGQLHNYTIPFGVDYDLLALLMRRETDDDGRFQIRWGEQMIA